MLWLKCLHAKLESAAHLTPVCAYSLFHSDVTQVPDGTPGEKAFEIIKTKKQDAVVVCDGNGCFVSGV